MKHIVTTLFLLLLLAVTGAANGQLYEKVIKMDSTSWDSYHWELFGIMRDHAYVKKDGDAFLLYFCYNNDGNYNVVGNIREESGRLWITYSVDPDNEMLLMDMNLEVGDVFDMNGHETYVREIQYKNGRKIIIFDYASYRWFNEPLMFIEGVGRNIMTFDRYGDRDESYQPCKYDDNDLIYSTDNPHFENCEYITTSVPDYCDGVQPLQVYSNPSKGEIIVNKMAMQNEPFTISLINCSGVVSKTLFCSENKAIISLEGLPSGLYLLQIVGLHHVNYKKIIVTK